MQRLSNMALSMALILFVLAVSLALIAAAWLMATPVLNEQSRSSLSKWLFISLLAMGLNQANAQTSTVNTYTVTEVYMKQLCNQPTVWYATITPPDTLSQSVQKQVRDRKQRISPKPAWPSDNLPPVATTSEPHVSSVFLQYGGGSQFISI